MKGIFFKIIIKGQKNLIFVGMPNSFSSCDVMITSYKINLIK
jgi:hypothetical protein